MNFSVALIILLSFSRDHVRRLIDGEMRRFQVIEDIFLMIWDKGFRMNCFIVAMSFEVKEEICLRRGETVLW